MPSKPENSELEGLLELAQRRVQTSEGSKFYNQPIGSPISEAMTGKPNARPVTIERLKSLQRQFVAAKKTGNTATMKDIQSEFSLALRKYAADRPTSQVISDLQGELVRESGDD